MVERERLDSVYVGRFNDSERRQKVAIWREIVAHLDRYVPADGAVLDIACDAGYFINEINRGERWATDVRDVAAELDAAVRFVRCDGLQVAQVLPRNHFGTVFMSNYLEHLESPAAVVEQLRVAAELLAPGGRVIVLQPNVRLIGARYWDFIDHRVPLTERSLVEAAELAGLKTVKVITRFLPYTTKSRLPRTAALVRMYLAIPFAWRLLGKQTLYVGERPR